ncbi:hypothetical protein [Novosphingobium sp. CECT 9465]|uniref:hypothetical protein n=1 Tax=Novosphingobium sp. CECT 9465 TaxID=2829794 RepID=UPI001E3C0FDF|nr:hypothetical protein [Novosphingobium sp. CECT 9465]
MAEFGKGIRSFRCGMSEEDQTGQRADEPVPNPQLDQQIEKPGPSNPWLVMKRIALLPVLASELGLFQRQSHGTRRSSV